MNAFLILACEQAPRSALAAGREKEGELATTSLEYIISPISISHRLFRFRYSNSSNVVASSPYFSRPAARAPRRACSQASLISEENLAVFYLVFHQVSRFIHLTQMVVIYSLLTASLRIFNPNFCNKRKLFQAASIECFHSRGQHLCKFIGTKERVCIRKEFNSHRTGLGQKHGRGFIVLRHQYGRRDVM